MRDLDDVAVVLSGGGAKGAFEAGVLEAVADAGLAPRVLAGTSAGALNAAAIACGIPAADVAGLWSSLESRHVWRLRRDVHHLLRPLHLLGNPRRLLGLGEWTTSEHLLDSVGWTWLVDQSPLRELVVDLLGGERLPIEDGRILSVSCVDAGTGEVVRFANRAPPGARPGDQVLVRELTVDHILASSAIPGLFRPVEIDGELYWDGGLVANTPLRAALTHHPDAAAVVAAGAIDRDHGPPESLGDVIGMIVDHLMRHAMVNDLDHAETVNRLVEAAPDATYHHAIELVPITPERTGVSIGSLLDFEPSVAARLIEAGRREAGPAVERLRRAVG